MVMDLLSSNVSTTEVLSSVPVVADPTKFERAVIDWVRWIPGLGRFSASGRALTAYRGGAWTVAGYGASQVVKLGSAIVLARMVAPQAFGLIALVNVFLSGLELLSDLGIGMDVIQHPRGDDPAFINTAFIIQVVRGIVLWGIAWALAYPFAMFYRQPAVLALAIVGSLSTLVRGFTSGFVWTLTRHVRLRELALMTTGTDVFGLIVSVIWALFSPTAWALVVGRVAASVAFAVVSHIVAENPISLSWDGQIAREILAFGFGIFLSSSTYFLAGEAERLVVGKFVNLIELGCFSLALSISSAVARGFQQLVSQVFFPMMSESVRGHRGHAIRRFKKARRLVLLLSGCMSVGFIIGGKWLVYILLGGKYAAAGWMLQLLGVRAALDLFASVAATMLFALGVTRFSAIANGSKFVFLAVGLSVAFGHFGLHAAIWVLLLASITTYVPLVVGLRTHFAPVIRTEMASFAVFVLVTSLVMACCAVVR